MPQPSSSSSSLAVLGGPFDGASVDIAYGFDQVLIGSSVDCRLRVDAPGVSPIHARLIVDGTSVTVEDAHSQGGVYVNDDRVTDRTQLRDGDIVWLGTPGDPGSLMLRCRLAPAPPESVAEPDPFFVGDGTVPFTPAMRAAPPAQALAAPPEEDPFFVAGPAPDLPPVLAAPALDEFALVEPDVAPPAPPQPAPPPLQVPSTPARSPVPMPVAPPMPAPVPKPVIAAPVAPIPAPAPRPSPSVAVPSVTAPELASVAPRPQVARPAADRAAQARPVSARPRPSMAPRAPQRSNRGTIIAVVVGLLVIAGAIGGFMAWRAGNAPRLTSVGPQRVRVGQSVTLVGKRFAPSAQDNTVWFGESQGTIVKATAEQLEATVPEMPLVAGADARIPVSVEVGRVRTATLELTVYQGPQVHGISPNVAMPGEVVELTGAGWSTSPSVRFGALQAEVVSARADKLRVRVPEIQGPLGTSAPVTVTQGEGVSNAAPFFTGHEPLLLQVQPASAAPGEIVTISGRGFREPGAMSAVVGDRRALIVSASETELTLVVPRAPAGATAIKLAINATGQVGEIAFEVPAPPDIVEFRFVAEPFEEQPASEHVQLSTALGPALVLSAAGGQSATTRALAIVGRLNAAAVSLKASLEADLEARGFAAGKPAIALKGARDPLIEVTPEDAAGYNKDWTRLGPRARPVTPGRLALWWTAVLRDLAQVLVRSEKPLHTAALGVEGRVLADLYQAARKDTSFGIPRKLVEGASPFAQGLRTLALRVPTTLSEPADSPVVVRVAPGASASPSPAAVAKAFKLEGEWRGRETVPEASRAISVIFKSNTGTLFYEGSFSVGFPLLTLEQPQKGVVRFSVGVRGSVRYYQGRFDGQKISGTIAPEERGATTGSFELEPR
jgi:FHA domain/IPT/TIG domain